MIARFLFLQGMCIFATLLICLSVLLTGSDWCVALILPLGAIIGAVVMPKLIAGGE